MILILVWTPPIAFGMDTLRVSECTYHQRSPGTVEGVPLFMDMWRQGCTTISFLQYAENAQVYFQYSPCTSYNLKTWSSEPCRQGHKSYPRIIKKVGDDGNRPNASNSTRTSFGLVEAGVEV
jgi:hypothetical protein